MNNLIKKCYFVFAMMVLLVLSQVFIDYEPMKTGIGMGLSMSSAAMIINIIWNFLKDED